MAAKKPKQNAAPSPEAGGPKPKRPGGSAFANLQEANEFLRSRLNVEAMNPAKLDVPATFRLDRMSALLERLGNPQGLIKTVHIAGSKGKGSVCEMLSSCLEACGYTVGVYTSPHLVDVSERIRISQVRITESEFTSLLSRAAGASEDLPKTVGEATSFELFTAVALLHFAEQAVDVAIIETGMGGRFDATNVIQPEVVALTAVQLEHTALLGKTLTEIASHKAGIIKAGAPAVSVPQHPEVVKVFRDEAAALGTTVEFLGEEIDFSYRMESSTELGPHSRVVVTSTRSSFEHLPAPFKGEHQAINCGLALAVLDKLRQRGFETPEQRVALGLARTPSHGRLEMIHPRPRIMIDGAHTPASVQALMKAVGAQIRYDSMVCVFGCAADKDVPGMLQSLATGADKIIFTRASDNARSMDPRDLQRKFAEVSGKMTQTAPCVKDALNTAARAVSPRDDLILVTGSFAVAGEAKRLMHQRARPDPDQTIREVKPGGPSNRPGAPPARPGTISPRPGESGAPERAH